MPYKQKTFIDCSFPHRAQMAKEKAAVSQVHQARLDLLAQEANQEPRDHPEILANSISEKDQWVLLVNLVQLDLQVLADHPAQMESLAVEHVRDFDATMVTHYSQTLF